MQWWNNREENEVAWRVKVEDLKRGFDLDVKNPHREEADANLSAAELLNKIESSFDLSRHHLNQIRGFLR